MNVEYICLQSKGNQMDGKIQENNVIVDKDIVACTYSLNPQKRVLL
jgi:hypothetical protein